MYGVEPRASTDSGSISATGTPTAASPAAMATGLGRRDGAPKTTTAAAPDVQPASSATMVLNEMSAATNRTTVKAMTTAQPARRHRRDTHGAAAVTKPVTAASPNAVANRPGSMIVNDWSIWVTWAPWSKMWASAAISVAASTAAPSEDSNSLHWRRTMA